MSELRERWEREVSEYRKSGKRQIDYARERGISASQLNYWLRRLGEEKPGFVELYPEGVSKRGNVQSSIELELSLPGGVLLRMRGV
jgi:transposase-like protein